MATIPQTSAQAEILIARLAAARATLTNEATILRDRLDLQRQVKKSIFLKPLAWLGGSTAAGLLVSLALPRHLKKPQPIAKKKRGFMGFLIGSVFSLLRPLLQKHAIAFLTKRFLTRQSPDEPTRPRRSNLIEI